MPVAVITDGLTVKAFDPNPLAEKIAAAVRDWWIEQGVSDAAFGGEHAVKSLASLASVVAGICGSNSEPQGPFDMFVAFVQHLLSTGTPVAPSAPPSTAKH